MSESIVFSKDGDIATVTLNRPEKLNAFDLAMWDRLGGLLAEASADDDLRCILLRGAGGKAFASGADIGEFETVRSSAEQAAAYGRVVDRATHALGECRHPTLAVIEGACIGGGLELALECDIRLANASARFGIPINRIGHCLPYGGMTTLVEVAGRVTAMEMLLEGRILDAQEAYERRLVTRVVADDALNDEASAAARRIARSAPLAARTHKRMARRALDPAPLSEAEWAEPFASCDSEDYREGVRAFLAKEKPVFKGA